MTINIDQFSVSAIYIEMRFQDQHISTGTAFVYQKDDGYLLITNWHNVTGINPISGKHLSSTLAEPDNVRVWFNEKNKLGNWANQDLPLRGEDGTCLWYEHPSQGRRVDIAALPFRPSPGVEPYPINAIPMTNDIRVIVGQDIIILGFPLGLTVTGGFPIWKRATIATEPDIPVEGLPKFMVDTASREGMSGSPVIVRPSGPYISKDGNTVMSTGTPTMFVGIYSGRIGAEDEFKAQLGIIWKVGAIEETVAGKKFGAK